MIQEFLNTVQPDTIYTVTVSLSIFILGLLFKWGFESYQKRKYLKNRASFFINSAESMIEPMDKQAEEFKNLSEAVADINERNLVLNIVSDLNFFFFSPDIIADIHRYISVKWWKDVDELSLKKISKVITAIQKQFDHGKYNFDNFMRKQERNADAWQQATNSIFRFNDFLINQHRANGKPSEDEFFHDFNTTVHEWTEERDDYDLKHIHDKLIFPLKKVCKNHSGDPRALQVLPILNECRSIFERFQENRSRYHDLFENDSNQIKDNKKLYAEAIEELKELT